MNASYTTELVVELATISRVNISRKHTIHHTILYHTWAGAGFIPPASFVETRSKVYLNVKCDKGMQSISQAHQDCLHPDPYQLHLLSSVEVEFIVSFEADMLEIR